MIFERWKIFIGFSFQELWNKLVFAYNHKNIRSFFKSRPCKYLWVFNLGFGLAFLSHFTLNRCGFFSVGILCQFAPFFFNPNLILYAQISWSFSGLCSLSHFKMVNVMYKIVSNHCKRFNFVYLEGHLSFNFNFVDTCLR